MALILRLVKGSKLTWQEVDDNFAGLANATLIVTGSIGETKLADGAVTSDKLAASSVVTAKLANESVTDAKLANESVTTAKLGNAAVSSQQLANSVVLTQHIADGNITLTKMANLAANTVIGRTSSNGVPEAISVTANARTLLAGATFANMRSTLGVALANAGGMLVGVGSESIAEIAPGSVTAGTSPTFTAAVTGYQLLNYWPFVLSFHAAATAAATLNVNGTGAKDLYLNNQAISTTNLIASGCDYICYYDGTRYQLLNSTRQTIGPTQTLQNMTSSRALNTAYTNSTGRPIVIYVDVQRVGNAYHFCYINGQVYAAGSYLNSGGGLAFSVVVPVGATYQAVSGDVNTLNWWEYR